MSRAAASVSPSLESAALRIDRRTDQKPFSYSYSSRHPFARVRVAPLLAPLRPRTAFQAGPLPRSRRWMDPRAAGPLHRATGRNRLGSRSRAPLRHGARERLATAPAARCGELRPRVGRGRRDPSRHAVATAKSHARGAWRICDRGAVHGSNAPPPLPACAAKTLHNRALAAHTPPRRGRAARRVGALSRGLWQFHFRLHFASTVLRCRGHGAP